MRPAQVYKRESNKGHSQVYEVSSYSTFSSKVYLEKALLMSCMETNRLCIGLAASPGTRHRTSGTLVMRPEKVAMDALSEIISNDGTVWYQGFKA